MIETNEIKSNNLPIIEVNHGLANRFSDHIEINKHLRKCPNLLQPMLEHEFAHTDKPVSLKDFKLDFLLPQAIHYKQLFWFMIKHPSSFTQLIPLYYTKRNGWVYDFNLTIMYIMMTIVFGGIIFLGINYF